jgi:hypothetical protein
VAVKIGFRRSWRNECVRSSSSVGIYTRDEWPCRMFLQGLMGSGREFRPAPGMIGDRSHYSDPRRRCARTVSCGIHDFARGRGRRVVSTCPRSSLAGGEILDLTPNRPTIAG